MFAYEGARVRPYDNVCANLRWHACASLRGRVCASLRGRKYACLRGRIQDCALAQDLNPPTHPPVVVVIRCRVFEGISTSVRNRKIWGSV